VKVKGYGRSIYGYYDQVKKSKPKEKTIVEIVLGVSFDSSKLGNSLIAAMLALYYCFFILLGLTLDKTTNVPPWVFFLFIIFLSFILIGITVALYLRHEKFDFLRNVIKCKLMMLIAIFAAAFNLIGLAVFSLVTIETEKAATGIWVFCGLGFGIVMFLLFTFQCQSQGLRQRYGLAFRLFTSLSFTCFCLGIVMLVYTRFNSRSIDSYGWSMAAWVFSFFMMLFYLYFLGLCFSNGYYSPKGCSFCLFGTMELLTCGLVFSTAILCYINIVLHQGLPWIKLFIPIYLLPIFSTILCFSYKKKFEEEGNLQMYL